jgi:predicted DNA-binding protein (UPF0251 family)
MRNCAGRKRKNRKIEADHSKVCFKPCGLRREGEDAVIIYEDELEAIRLADLELLYQEDSAEKMGISRTTFARLIRSGHQKIADALINQKTLEVQKR